MGKATHIWIWTAELARGEGRAHLYTVTAPTDSPLAPFISRSTPLWEGAKFEAREAVLAEEQCGEFFARLEGGFIDLGSLGGAAPPDVTP